MLAQAFPHTLKPIRDPRTCEPRRYLNTLVNNGLDGELHFKLTKLACARRFLFFALDLIGCHK